MPVILLILSFPAGILAYTLALRVMQSVSLPTDASGLLLLFVPLLVAGLVMLPFLIPFFDRKAKQDLAEYRRIQAAAVPAGGEQPGAGPSVGGPENAEPSGAQPSSVEDSGPSTGGPSRVEPSAAETPDAGPG